MVRRRLSADGIHTSFTASSTVCHRFCSALSDANIENNVIVARIFGLGLPGQAESTWRCWGRMATRNGVIADEEEDE